MSRAVILQHAPYAGPGRIVPVFRDFGIPCEVRKLWQGDEVPTDLDELRVLVVKSCTAPCLRWISSSFFWASPSALVRASGVSTVLLDCSTSSLYSSTRVSASRPSSSA